MKRIIIFVIAFSICLCATAPLLAQVQLKKLGQSTMNFLEVSVMPKAASLGNAYTAVGSGAESIFYNPAGLANVSSDYSAVLSTTNWIADIDYYAGAVAFKVGNVGTFGLNFLTVNYGDIYGTRLAAQAADPVGYEDIGLLDNIGAYAYGISFSRQISTLFSMGGTVQRVGQQLGSNILASETKDNQESMFAFNFGIMYYTGFKSFRFGMVIRNFAPSAQYEEITASLPLSFGVGAAMDMLDLFMPDHSEDNSLLLTTEFMHPNDYTERVNVGAEYTLMKLFSLRGGYQFNRDLAGLTAGFGITPTIAGNQLDLSYSYDDVDIFDGVSRLSIGVAF